MIHTRYRKTKYCSRGLVLLIQWYYNKSNHVGLLNGFMNLEVGDEDDHPPYHKYITEQTIHTIYHHNNTIKQPTLKLSLNYYPINIILFSILFPTRRKLLRSLIITSQTMNSTLNHNQTEFRITILSVTFQVLTNRYCLLYQEVHIFRKRRSQS